MIEPSPCYHRGCIHYIGVDQPDGTELSERNICKAFPDGIPADIESGENLHLNIHPDQDNWFVFKQGPTQ